MIYYSIDIPDLLFDVQLNGETRLVGSWVSGAPNIAYPLPETNVFILGKPDPNFVKMVKIRVTGEKTFDWLEARVIEKYPDECGKQSTFHEGCFLQGNSVNQNQYDVKLVAKIRGVKGNFVLNMSDMKVVFSFHT